MKAKIIDLFNPKRFGLLIKRDALTGYRGTLISMGAGFGVILLMSIISAWQNGEPDLYQGLFGVILFLGGFIVTSLSFREIHQNGRSYLYLTLPGSHLEKFVSKLLISSVGYAAAALAYTMAASLLSEGINLLIFGRGNGLFRPFEREIFITIAAYLVAQSFFLVGSVYFRKLSFLKTVLAVNVIAIAFGILGGVFGWFLFRPYIEMGRMNPEYFRALEQYAETFNFADAFEMRIKPWGMVMYRTCQVIFWGLLAPTCWIISYFRLSEKEV